MHIQVTVKPRSLTADTMRNMMETINILHIENRVKTIHLFHNNISFDSANDASNYNNSKIAIRYLQLKAYILFTDKTNTRTGNINDR